MAPIYSHKISVMKSSCLRFGIKWDPLERDDLQESFAFGAIAKSRQERTLLSKQIKLLRLIRTFLQFTFLFRNSAPAIEKSVDYKKTKIIALNKFLSEEAFPSYDLDLCCSCYDRDGKFVKFISPLSTETRDSLQGAMAFMHSGDDETGTGDTFDEEILVNLSAIDSAIHQVFFAIVSINHGFDKIKGFFWSVVSTKDEKELLSAISRTRLEHSVHVMAKLSREGADWSLAEIAEYCPFEENQKSALGVGINRLIMERYLSAKASPIKGEDLAR